MKNNDTNTEIGCSANFLIIIFTKRAPLLIIVQIRICCIGTCTVNRLSKLLLSFNLWIYRNYRGHKRNIEKKQKRNDFAKRWLISVCLFIFYNFFYLFAHLLDNTSSYYIPILSPHLFSAILFSCYHAVPFLR